jgi:hypothetical protein
MASTGRKQEPYVYGSLGGRTIAIVDAPALPVQAQGKPVASTTQVAAAPSADQSAAPRASASPAPSSADIAEA